MKRLMRILHTADNHLNEDATICRRVIKNDAGVNVRAEELKKSLWNVVFGHIDETVDAVIVAGDIFHKCEPTNGDHSYAAHILDYAADRVGNVIIISGNHDISKEMRATAIAPLLGRRPNLHIFENLDSKIIGRVGFVCVPWGFDPPKANECFILADPEPRVRILIHHTTISGYDTYGEPAITADRLYALGYDAYMLGHYHGQAIIGDRMGYPSCPEILNFNEAHDVKGFFFWNIYEDGSVELEPIRMDPLRKFLTVDISDTFPGLADVSWDTVVRLTGSISRDRVPDMLAYMAGINLQVITNEVTILGKDRIINSEGSEILTLAHESDRQILKEFLLTQETPEEKIAKLMELHVKYASQEA